MSCTLCTCYPNKQTKKTLDAMGVGSCRFKFLLHVQDMFFPCLDTDFAASDAVRVYRGKV
jgi:hypothetical protein